MVDLFDFDAKPNKPAAPAKPIEWLPPPEVKAPPAPKIKSRRSVEVFGPRAVASFTCVCSCQDEVREPCPQEIPCWGCKRPMRRWLPLYQPPWVSARPWDGKAA